ncbi:nitroreductase family protein [Aliifodinibius sp. S!AR15-10]|uniref:nitroreductase family protein n=1 Tax=Aliifodinibius sp. S!AR15-10 TaxID=2950437 RepID=UPI00285FC16A|nr:nitroreductase family protein [Aliifodinibius sp. S!AR15-10]MDR8392966.1 nitroreductase family protein [Aliifodinibius sp. S!AR15-10]
MSTETTNLNTDVEYPVHDLIQQRWSPRSFSDEAVDGELLRQLFEAARWSPSSYNEQPWRFIVATKEHPQKYQRMLDVLLPGNQRWAQEAPVLILTIVKIQFSRNGSTNRAAKHDLGQAVAHLTFEATNHDLYLHQMAGIDLDKARETFSIPEGYEPFTGIALGYLGDADPPSSRKRKEIDEFVFQGDWENREPIGQDG